MWVGRPTCMICYKRSAQAAGQSRVEQRRAPGPPCRPSGWREAQTARKMTRFWSPPYIFDVNWCRCWWPSGQLGSQSGGTEEQHHNVPAASQGLQWGASCRRAGGRVTWRTSNSGIRRIRAGSSRRTRSQGRGVCNVHGSRGGGEGFRVRSSRKKCFKEDWVDRGVLATCEADWEQEL